jgi:hypothetical protein
MSGVRGVHRKTTGASVGAGMADGLVALGLLASIPALLGLLAFGIYLLVTHPADGSTVLIVTDSMVCVTAGVRLAMNLRRRGMRSPREQVARIGEAGWLLCCAACRPTGSAASAAWWPL